MENQRRSKRQVFEEKGLVKREEEKESKERKNVSSLSFLLLSFSIHTHTHIDTHMHTHTRTHTHRISTPTHLASVVDKGHGAARAPHVHRLRLWRHLLALFSPTHTRTHTHTHTQRLAPFSCCLSRGSGTRARGRPLRQTVQGQGN